MRSNNIVNDKKRQVKVLCSGDVNGNFKQLIARIALVNQKAGPFDILFCVGEFFGPDNDENEKVINGEIDFPVPTYILGPCCPSTSTYYPAESVEFSQSLTYLGKKGTLMTANGLLIGYFSGIEAPAIFSPLLKTLPFQFDTRSIDDLLTPLAASSGFMGVDILLTSIWPANVWLHSTNQPSIEPSNTSKLLARLASGLRPRYHFAGQGIHYELNNTNKQKWLYAFSCTPMRELSRDELEYLHNKAIEDEKRRREEGNSVQYRFDNNNYEDEEHQEEFQGRRKGKRRGGENYNEKRPKIDPSTCWFCLSNIDAEKHLIVSVGTNCYAAMPKGPLMERHLLVMSIVVAPTEVRDEVNKFKDAYWYIFIFVFYLYIYFFASLFSDRNNEVVCVFERNYKTEHMQIQFVPIPKSKAKSLKSTFLNAAQLKNIEFCILGENEQVWDLLNEGSPYFYVELPDGTKMLSRTMSRFPLQFGREVLASKALLDCEDHIDWRNCSLEKDKEVELVNKLKNGFKPFDFTNTEDSDEDD
uniref:CWF19-like protein 1 n=1 Tax=Meloidogyne floridensis TaxID=298350 RepID=A0A915NHI0_9BILA